MTHSNISPPGSRWICLTGFMGSGKTTVGACLAQLLGWQFVDLDAEVVAREQRPIAEIFRGDGEAHFRELERRMLVEILGRDSGPTVIALGGGTFVQPANREILRAHGARTIYLEGEFPVLLERCGAAEGTRPLMRDVEQFRKLHEERQPLYRSAELIVQIADRTPQQIAAEIAAGVEKWTARPAVPE